MALAPLSYFYGCLRADIFQHWHDVQNVAIAGRSGRGEEFLMLKLWSIGINALGVAYSWETKFSNLL